MSADLRVRRRSCDGGYNIDGYRVPLISTIIGEGVGSFDKLIGLVGQTVTVRVEGTPVGTFTVHETGDDSIIELHPATI